MGEIVHMKNAMTTSKSQRKNTTIRLLPRIWKEIQILAIEQNCDASDLVEIAIETYLQGNKQGKAS
jgi:hypothetical protein